MHSITFLLPFLAAAAAAPLVNSVEALPVLSLAPRDAAVTPVSLNIRNQATTTAPITTGAQVTVAPKSSTTIATPRLPFTSVTSASKKPSSTTTKSATKTKTSSPTSTAPSYTNRPFLLTLLPAANVTTTNTTAATSTPEASTVPIGYLGTDKQNTWSASNLMGVRVLKARAATFKLASNNTLLQQSPTKPKTFFRVQAASSGQNYAGLGASPGKGFSNGEDMVCSVASVKVLVTGAKGVVSTVTQDRLRCQTKSNGHSIIGSCKRFSWLWLFGTAADVKAFCPGGSGALELGIVWL